MYHITNYLSEVYIFQQRLKVTTEYIIKLCKKKKFKQVEFINLKKIYKTLKSLLDPLIIIRGKHTHNERFSDEEIQMLEVLEQSLESDEFLMTDKERRAYKNDIDNILNYAQRKWYELVMSNYFDYKVMLHHYAVVLEVIESKLRDSFIQ